MIAGTATGGQSGRVRVRFSYIALRERLALDGRFNCAPCARGPVAELFIAPATGFRWLNACTFVVLIRRAGA